MGPGQRRKSVLSRETPEEVPRRAIVLALPAPSAPSPFVRKRRNPSRARSRKVEPPVVQVSCLRTSVEQKLCDLLEIPVMEGDKKRKLGSDVPKSGNKTKIDHGNTSDLSLSMSLVTHQSFPTTSDGSGEEIARGDVLKRDIIARDEEIKHKGEELDLELRLGTGPPKGN